MCILNLRSNFVYKEVRNSDLATVSAIIKKIKNQLKFSLMHRSSGDSDLQCRTYTQKSYKKGLT